MTHIISKNGTIINQNEKTMRCPNDPGTHCKPLACLGAEIVQKLDHVPSDKIRIKFYCLPQPREIILGDHDTEAAKEAEAEADFFSVVE